MTGNVREWTNDWYDANYYPFMPKKISFEILSAYSRRQDRRKFMAPGAVSLQYGADGKIERLRLYLSETEEVVAL